MKMDIDPAIIQWRAWLAYQCAMRHLTQTTQSRLIEYASTLLRQGLPVIFDLSHLSRLMGVHNAKLAAMVFNTERFYKRFRLRKRAGDWRDIDAPTLALKHCQRWILRNILDNIAVSECVQGFVPRRSILTNATIHARQPLVLNLDVKDFFPSIGWSKVFLVFRRLGYTKKVSYYLTRLATLGGSLPQGSPTSPSLANLAVHHLDTRLSRLAEGLGCRYSRYADDITFSGEFSPGFFINLVRRIVQEEGLKLNETKIRVMRKHKRQEVTGLVVNQRPSIPRSRIRWLRQQVYYLQKHGLDNCRGHLRATRKNTKEFLYGHALFVRMVHKEKGERFLDQLDRVSW